MALTTSSPSKDTFVLRTVYIELAQGFLIRSLNFVVVAFFKYYDDGSSCTTKVSGLRSIISTSKPDFNGLQLEFTFDHCFVFARFCEIRDMFPCIFKL